MHISYDTCTLSRSPSYVRLIARVLYSFGAFVACSNITSNECLTLSSSLQKVNRCSRFVNIRNISILARASPKQIRGPGNEIQAINWHCQGGSTDSSSRFKVI